MHTKNKQKVSTTEELENGKILPLVFKLAVPAIIAQLITFLYNIVDRMFVAQIGDSGMDALAALGIVLPITLIMQRSQTSSDSEAHLAPESKWERESRTKQTGYSTPRSRG